MSGPAGVPSLQDLTPDDLRGADVVIKKKRGIINIMRLHHPETVPQPWSVETVFHKTGAWCQKG